MKKLLLSAAVLLGLSAPTLAQVNAVPQFGLNTGNIRSNSFAAVSIGLVPAASATDIFCLSGSSSKTVSLKQITVSGTAGTAVTTPVVILRRVSLDTGGTAATGNALPVPGGIISTNGTSVATTTAYTANPTINDSSPTLLRAAAVSLPTSAAAIVQNLVLNFGTNVEEYEQGADIVKGSTQQICVNLNGVSVSSGVLYITAEWTEQ